jgi:hypothetical protein
MGMHEGVIGSAGVNTVTEDVPAAIETMEDALNARRVVGDVETAPAARARKESGHDVGESVLPALYFCKKRIQVISKERELRI